MTKKLHGLIDGDIVLYECIAGKDDEVLAELCYSIGKRIETLVEDCGVETADIFLSGPREVNYRYEVYPAYKAKRPPKPAHLEGAKKYMFDKLGAIEGTVGENDDQIGIAGYEAYKDAMMRWAEDGSPEGDERWYSKTVIMTTDKDLKMIPGWHYSWSPKSDHDWIWITMDKGYEWFFTQMLTGDSTDGIPGLKGVGPKAAEKVMSVSPTNSDRLKNVVDKYVNKGHDLDYFLTMADLLWIQRSGATGRHFITHLAEKINFDIAAEFPQPEPEPENKEQTSAVKAFASKGTGKAAAAFAKKGKKVDKTDEHDEKFNVLKNSSTLSAADLDLDKAEAALKEGIEGEYIPTDKPQTMEVPKGEIVTFVDGAQVVDPVPEPAEVPVDPNPDVKTYPDGTAFEFNDNLPF